MCSSCTQPWYKYIISFLGILPWFTKSFGYMMPHNKLVQHDQTLLHPCEANKVCCTPHPSFIFIIFAIMLAIFSSKRTHMSVFIFGYIRSHIYLFHMSMDVKDFSSVWQILHCYKIWHHCQWLCSLGFSPSLKPRKTRCLFLKRGREDMA